LFAHEDDPDIDEPFVAPQGQTLGKASGIVRFMAFICKKY
jgi:uncharacterized UBP type Zn finger protein